MNKENSMAYDVFISHSRDNEIANVVYEYLSNIGISCFLDERCLKPGELFPRHIHEARESCSIVVLILSPESDSSIAVNSEMNDLYKKKKIIPLRIQDFTPKNLMVFIGAIQWLDAFEPPFEKHLPKLLEAVGPPILPPPPPPPPTKPEEIITSLKKYIKELALNLPSFNPQEERLSIGEHALRTMRLFNKYRVFNHMEFPENVISRQKFMVILALHDIGMAKVTSRDEIKLKYGITQKAIKWLFNQPDFKAGYCFNAQEERLSVALVSNEPIWRYLNNRFDEITCAAQIVDMAVKAGIEIDSAAFFLFFKLVMIYYLCDMGSYSKSVGGDRIYDFIVFDESNEEIRLSGAEKQKIDNLEAVIKKVMLGAVVFTDHIWKRTKDEYFNNFARNNVGKMKQGEIVKGRYYKYRYNSKLRTYEICPRSSTKAPALYDPNY